MKEEEFDWSPSDAHSPPQVDAAATAADIIQRIKQDLVENMDAPEKKRKQIMRDYLKRWHPDKNDEESKGTATAVTHFLYANKVQFLAPRSSEMTPLLSLLRQVCFIGGAYAVFLAFLGLVWWVAWRLSLSKA
eukprot:g29618.t1